MAIKSRSLTLLPLPQHKAHLAYIRPRVGKSKPHLATYGILCRLSAADGLGWDEEIPLSHKTGLTPITLQRHFRKLEDDRLVLRIYAPKEAGKIRYFITLCNYQRAIETFLAAGQLEEASLIASYFAEVDAALKKFGQAYIRFVPPVPKFKTLPMDSLQDFLQDRYLERRSKGKTGTSIRDKHTCSPRAVITRTDYKRDNKHKQYMSTDAVVEEQRGANKRAPNITSTISTPPPQRPSSSASASVCPPKDSIDRPKTKKPHFEDLDALDIAGTCPEGVAAVKVGLSAGIAFENPVAYAIKLQSNGGALNAQARWGKMLKAIPAKETWQKFEEQEYILNNYQTVGEPWIKDLRGVTFFLGTAQSRIEFDDPKFEEKLKTACTVFNIPYPSSSCPASPSHGNGLHLPGVITSIASPKRNTSSGRPSANS